MMGEAASVERRPLTRQLCGNILLPAGRINQDGIDRSRRMAAADARIFLPRQLQNPLNAKERRQDLASSGFCRWLASRRRMRLVATITASRPMTPKTTRQ